MAEATAGKTLGSGHEVVWSAATSAFANGASLAFAWWVFPPERKLFIHCPSHPTATLSFLRWWLCQVSRPGQSGAYGHVKDKANAYPLIVVAAQRPFVVLVLVVQPPLEKPWWDYPNMESL